MKVPEEIGMRNPEIGIIVACENETMKWPQKGLNRGRESEQNWHLR